MAIRDLGLGVALAGALVCLAMPGMAQTSSPDDSNVHFSGMLHRQQQAKAPPPPVVAPPAAWPRLDPGAVICRTQQDLLRRAAIMRGEQAAPADCFPVTQRTAITILHRDGPGATEIQVSGGSETGWTDAWLPANPPPGTTASR